MLVVWTQNLQISANTVLLFRKLRRSKDFISGCREYLRNLVENLKKNFRALLLFAGPLEVGKARSYLNDPQTQFYCNKLCIYYRVETVRKLLYTQCISIS